MTGSKGKNLVVALSAVAILLLVASFVYFYAFLGYRMSLIALLFRAFEIFSVVSVLVLAFNLSKANSDKLLVIPCVGIILYNSMTFVDALLNNYLSDMIAIVPSVAIIILCIATIVAIILKKNSKWFAMAFVAIGILDVLNYAYSMFGFITYDFRYGIYYILLWLGNITTYVSVLMFYLWRSATPNEVPLTGAAAELNELVLSLRQGQITPEEFGIKRAEIISRL